MVYLFDIFKPFFSSNEVAFLKHPRTPMGVTSMDYQSADSEHLVKRIRMGPSDEVRKIRFQLFCFMCFIFKIYTSTCLLLAFFYRYPFRVYCILLVAAHKKIFLKMLCGALLKDPM